MEDTAPSECPPALLTAPSSLPEPATGPLHQMCTLPRGPPPSATHHLLTRVTHSHFLNKKPDQDLSPGLNSDSSVLMEVLRK